MRVVKHAIQMVSEVSSISLHEASAVFFFIFELENAPSFGQLGLATLWHILLSVPEGLRTVLVLLDEDPVQLFDFILFLRVHDIVAILSQIN